jgi:mRNA interferase MazF
MPTTTTYEFGDVILIPFPFTDQTTSKKRPAVVVSSAAYHRERRDLIIMAVTSQVKPAAAFGEVIVAQWKDSGLLKPSVIKPVLTTVEKSLVLRKLGRLQKEDLQALQEALQDILGE